MKKLFLLVATVAAMTACGTNRGASVPSEAQLAQERLVQTMLDAKMYKVDFKMAIPQTGRSFSLTYPYFVSVIDNRVESFLPYFGRAYTLPYGGGEGLNFEATITNYTVKTGRKGQWQISFEARTVEDNYTFNLDIYPSGESYLNIGAINKQGMSFSGAIDPEPEFEAVRVE
jgi:hypothetical protein